MHSDLHLHLARATAAERAASATSVARRPAADTVALRLAGPAEAPAVARLAALDGVPPLEGDVLLAVADGAPVAALSLADGRVAADPFAPTANAVELLQVRGGHRRPRRFRPRLVG